MNNVISTKVKIFRNVKDYKFVPKLEEQKKDEIIDKLSSALKGEMNLLNINTVDENIGKFLKSRGLISNAANPNFFLGKSNNCSITLFDDEHITITSLADGYDKSAFEVAQSLASLLSNKINLSYSDNYGYLMSDLSKIGAGVRIECVMDFNSIVALEKIEQVRQNVRKLGYSLAKTDDKNLFVLSTVCNLGFSESEIFSEFDKMVNKLQDLEIESAKMLDVSNHDELLDRALRSVAVLKSAYIMDYVELKSQISTLRTALNLGLIEISSKTLNELQNLTYENKEFISRSEAIGLAKNVQKILKGDKNV